MVDYWAVASICGFMPQSTLHEAHSRGFDSLAWSFSQYAISAGTLEAIDG